MGYYTRFTLRLVDLRDDKSDELDAMFLNRFRFDSALPGEEIWECLGELNFTFRDGDRKWYSCDKQMKAASAASPGVVFILDGVGEKQGDIWRTFYLNGASHEWRVVATTPPELTPEILAALRGETAVPEHGLDDSTGFNVAPARYTRYGRETIDRIRDLLGDAGFAAYCRGQVVKYTDRAGLKGPDVEDRKKASFYAQMVQHVEDPTRYPDPRSYRAEYAPYRRETYKQGVE